MTNAPRLDRRILAVAMGFVLIVCGILARAVSLQLFPNARLVSMAKKQFQSKVLIRPRRGMIADRNGEPLAINSDAQSLAANPSKMDGKTKAKESLARALAKALDVPFPKLHAKFKEPREFIWVKRRLSETDLQRLKRVGILDADGTPISGLWLVKESRRIYPHGELASHILGDVNLDMEGLEGIELQENQKLSGKVTSVSAVKDALGRPTFIDSVTAEKVQDGEAVHLTIDASLQFSVEQELKAALQKTGAKSGTVIVMDYRTGEILAMANAPTFDPNVGAASQKRRNRAVTDGFEPGSTVKSLMLAWALKNGAKLSDTVNAEGGSFTVQGKKISEAESHEKFGNISLKRMLQVSSNVGAAKLALKLGAEKIDQLFKAFELGSRTGLGFPGEIAGRIPERDRAHQKDWQQLALANFGFGQGILITPIQMLRAYAAIANGGLLVRPRLVKSLSKDLHAGPKRILDQSTAAQVQEALLSVTQTGGTGVKAVYPGIQVAGKTGTAQTVDPATKRYSRTRFISSFIGYPVHEKLGLVVFASLDEPRGVYYASETAAPLFRDVLEAIVHRFGIPIENPEQAREQARELASEPVQKPQDLPKSEPIQYQGTEPSQGHLWKMPSLVGLTQREVFEKLRDQDFEIEVQSTGGLVQRHEPPAGKVVASGSLIRLYMK
ncbi:MAG: hypothetical protein JNL01_05555 [Bdellovibrionales bacterium]|nr:hypothetical protein [Bdellovibrionales bacterium]